MSECQTKAGNQECFDKLEKLSLSLLLLLSLLSLFHSLYLDMLNNFCFHVYDYDQKSLSHSFTFTTFATFTLFQSLIQSLSTCWTSFVFISMLKTHCLLLKIAMVFFGPHPHHPILTLSHSHPLSLSLFLTLTLFQSLIQSLSTCLTTFVLISMLKSRCL